MQSESESKIEPVIQSFFARRGGVCLVFLFGSAAAGRLTPESDVDVAVLFVEKPDPHRLNSLREDLGAALKRDADLVVLNEASPILRMQVLKHGKLLYSSASAQYSRFFTATVNEYDDLKRVRRPIEEAVFKAGTHA